VDRAGSVATAVLTWGVFQAMEGGALRRPAISPARRSPSLHKFTRSRRGPVHRQLRYVLVSEQESPGGEHLHTYLNDHLAGSVVAVELLDHLIEQHSEDRFGKFFNDLRNDIRADQEELRDLIGKIGGKESALRKAAGWVSEKFGRVKIGDADDSAQRLQALEGLALGITGKKLLWRSLGAVASNFPALQGTDFGKLEKRAQEQFERVENLRLETAREAFRA
jgi:hypothetical protein